MSVACLAQRATIGLQETPALAVTSPGVADWICEVVDMAQGRCSLCEKRAMGRGWCSMHYARWRKHGDPHYGEPLTLDQHLALHSDRSGGPNACWPWTGKLNHANYGWSHWHGPMGAHRRAYEHFVGPVPPGWEVDHVCHVAALCDVGDDCPHRRCVNPAHLLAVPKRVNWAKSNCPSAKRARQTHCKRGHSLMPGGEFVINRAGSRDCLPCRRIRSREWRENHKEAA